MCLRRINEMVFILDDDIHKCYKGSAHNCLEFDTPQDDRTDFPTLHEVPALCLSGSNSVY